MKQICSNKNEAINLLKQYFPKYRESAEYEEFFVCKEYGKVIGAISYSIIYERAEINYIVTKLEYRKKNVATDLIKKVIDEAKKNDCQNITLEVEEANKKAINLYEKLGFKIEATRKNYYNNNSGKLMRKELR